VPVQLHVLVRRFRGEQTDCSRAIFTERLPTVAPPYARSTPRHAEVLTRLGVALGGEAAARQWPGRGFVASADTVLRRVHQATIAPAWLEQAEASSLPAFRDFAAGLCRDERAVKAALTEQWSNGQTEGQVTKLKMLKRQMYGHASVGLLRQRLLLAA
jgi:hypothetical protein